MRLSERGRPYALSVVVAFDGLVRAPLTPAAVGAHEALAADAVPHVLAAAEVAGALGADLVSADVLFPAVLAVLAVVVGLTEGEVEVAPRVRLRVGGEERDDEDEEEGRHGHGVLGRSRHLCCRR